MEAVVDYLAREPQLGPGVELWLVEGTAESILSAQGLAERLEHLGRRTVKCTAADAMGVLAREGSVCVPGLALAPSAEGVERDGYALLRQGRLVDWLREERAIGYELLMGCGQGEIACVALDTVGTVSVRLEDSGLRVEPVFRDEELTGLDLHCELKAKVAQRDQVMTQGQLEELVLLYERLQAERLVAALELVQYWDADPARLEQKAVLACPGRKERIAQEFKDRYRTLDIRVIVSACVDPDGSVSE